MSWTHNTKDGTYACEACGTRGIRPGAACKCPVGSPAVTQEPRKRLAVSRDTKAAGLPTTDDHERDLIAVRVAQRRNREAIRLSATPIAGAGRDGFWARRLELLRHSMVKEQLAEERKTVLALFDMAERREEREEQDRDSGLAAELLAREGGVN